MEHEKPDPSGVDDSTQIPSGETQDSGGVKETAVKDTVAWDTYSKTLTQEKNLRERNRELQEKITTFEQQNKQAEEKRLQEQGEWQKIAESKEKELKEATERLNSYETNLQDSIKLQAFMEKIPGKIKRKEYLTHVPLDQIAINPDTGDVDESSLNEVATTFSQNFPDLIQVGTTKTLPNDAAQRTNSLSYESWLKLPVAQKRARMGDVQRAKAKT